jgi:phosphatidylserine/phosphatidylglycerophosphate/cardiolipin synthase-like enzyme
MTDLMPQWARDADLERIRRLGQALWMLVGTSVREQDLYWTRGLLGDNGPRELFDELDRRGALIGSDKLLTPGGLASFLGALGPHNESAAIRSRVVWTLPSAMGELESEAETYCYAAIETIEAARHSVWLVSPFLEARGIGRILEVLRQALHRDVHVRVITHGAGSLTDRVSDAVEQLRREAVSVGGRLTVFTVKGETGLLVHSKLVVADLTAAVLGSANLTDRGFSVNFEAGVVLTDSSVQEITEKIKRLLRTGLVEQTFSTQ